MKTTPTNQQLSIYRVTINNDSFDTTASAPAAAVSKCAYRYAIRHGENVALVQWNIKQGELRVKVKEV